MTDALAAALRLADRLKAAIDHAHTDTCDETCPLLIACEGQIRSLVERVRRAEEERDEARGALVCPLCVGGDPASGASCACNGSRHLRDAFEYLHMRWGEKCVEMMRAERDLAAMTKERDEARAERQRMSEALAEAGGNVLATRALHVAERDALAAARKRLGEAEGQRAQRLRWAKLFVARGHSTVCRNHQYSRPCQCICVVAEALAVLAEMEGLSSTPPEQASPYPPAEQLRVLAQATRHLLDDHDCDTHGHEVYRYALEAYERSAPPEPQEGA